MRPHFRGEKCWSFGILCLSAFLSTLNLSLSLCVLDVHILLVIFCVLSELYILKKVFTDFISRDSGTFACECNLGPLTLYYISMTTFLIELMMVRNQWQYYISG